MNGTFFRQQFNARRKNRKAGERGCQTTGFASPIACERAEQATLYKDLPGTEPEDAASRRHGVSGSDCADCLFRPPRHPQGGGMVPGERMPGEGMECAEVNRVFG